MVVFLFFVQILLDLLANLKHSWSFSRIVGCKMSDQSDSVWEHGDNVYLGFRCKYCKAVKRGGGAIRFKQHLAHHGSSVLGCPHVPTDVRDYFRRELDRTAERRKDRAKQTLRQHQVAGGGKVNEEDDEEMQAAMRLSREEEEFRQRQRSYGGQFESGGACAGSSQGASDSSQGGAESGLFGTMRRSASQRSGNERIQTRIDTGP